MDPLKYNKQAWNHQVESKNRWTIPVSSDEVAKAKLGDWKVVLTPSKPVPMNWFPQTNGLFKNIKILALASGGGQQAPLFAAAGADVTVFDYSPKQLEQDKMVSNREGLKIQCVEGDMRDLSVFKNETFDFIFHPCSNSFVPDIQPVWNEAFRVLKKNGTMIAGVVNPIVYAVDPDLDQKGIAQLKYKIPYSDLTSLTDEERKRYTDKNEPLCFGHTMEDQLGGQMKAGFHMIDLYEDHWGADAESAGAINNFIATFTATRSLKTEGSASTGSLIISSLI